MQSQSSSIQEKKIKPYLDVTLDIRLNHFFSK